jgi:hypothetical protein
MQHIENNDESGIMKLPPVVFVRNLPILLVSTGDPSGQPTRFFGGEQGTGVGGDVVEEKKQASGGTRAYAVRLGLPSFPQNVQR